MKQDLIQLQREFIEECRFSARLSDETIKSYKASIDLLIKIIPTITLETISDKTMNEFFKRLEQRERIIGRGIKKRGIKKSTVATYRSKLHRFFNWLKMKKYLKENPFNLMPYPAVEYIDRKWLKKEQIETILTAIDFKIKWANLFVQKRNVAILTLLLCCGLRKSELLGIKAMDIDFERFTLFVNHKNSKSKRDRVVPLNSLAVRKIKDYLAERKKRGCLTPYLFVSNNLDEKFSDAGFKHLIEILNEKSGVKFHAHQLRHTFAINLIKNGCDVNKLQQLMGHKDPRMTTTYLRCLPTSAMRQDVESLTFDNLV